MKPNEPASTDAFWRVPVDELYRQLASSADGLSTDEAARRLLQFGPNAVAPEQHRRLLLRLAKRLIEPLVAMLLFAAAVSGLTGDAASFAIILTVIVLSITLDVVQEHRAEITADALKRSVAIHSDVRRDGQFTAVPAEQVVPGDVVELRAGDLVPADGIVLSSRNAHVNEALMTGEPFPTEKRAAPCEASTPADAFNAVFAGTSLISGEATVLVVTTGDATKFGGIAAELASSEPPSAFERGVHKLGNLIMRLTIFLVLFVLLVHLSSGGPVLSSFLFAVALAVGLTPELLPMIVTVTLSRGALRMAGKSVIVKRLSAIHDLGAMDILCTDKTGTLTEAKISLIGHRGIQGTDDDHVLTLALINSAFSSGIRSPLDQAIVDRCRDDRIRAWIKIDEIPFDFERRCISVLAACGDKRLLIIKGAPERILALSTKIDADGSEANILDPALRESLRSMEHEEATRGNRVLAVAWKALPANCTEIHVEDEAELVFAGYCIFVDPPKASAADAIARLGATGVHVKIVSGDHEAVVQHVAEALKFPAHKMLTGAECGDLTDPALVARVEDVDLFARVTPDQKTRIIRALQARGYVVGFMGDGVNDAPAIRTADVGISVDGATDVARSAADMIMLAPDLRALADGVEEGRRTFSNILKYVRMATSSNFGNMLSMALASLVLPFLPLLPVQILLNNLLYDLSEIGIPFDKVDEGELSQPHTWDMNATLRFTLIMGATSSAFDLAMFGLLSQWFKAAPEVFRTAWFLESTATQILVIFIIRTHKPLLTPPSIVLVASSFSALLAAIAIAVTPAGGVFGFVHLPVSMIATITTVVATYLLAAEFMKAVAARR
jgi:Mg2+-importing ATPase